MTQRPSLWTPGSGIPLALPLAATPGDPNAQVNAPLSTSTVTNTPASSKTGEHAARRQNRHGHGRVGSRAIEQLADRLSERDREVLERVAEHRYLTTQQVQAFVFVGHVSDESAARTTRRVLARLERDYLLRSLKRRVGGVRAGSAAAVWQLAPAAARLLRDDGANYRTHEPSPRFLQHCLAVADVHLLLLHYRTVEAISEVAVQVEPASWRRYVGAGGEARWLQPDLTATLATADYVDRWFIEVDMGTESLPTLLSKCDQYEAYRASGIEQAEHDAFPLVLWFFTTGQRADKLRSAVARSSRLTPALYRFASPETITATIAQVSVGDIE